MLKSGREPSDLIITARAASTADPCQVLLQVLLLVSSFYSPGDWSRRQMVAGDQVADRGKLAILFLCGRWSSAVLGFSITWMSHVPLSLMASRSIPSLRSYPIALLAKLSLLFKFRHILLCREALPGPRCVLQLLNSMDCIVCVCFLGLWAPQGQELMQMMPSMAGDTWQMYKKWILN